MSLVFLPCCLPALEQGADTEGDRNSKKADARAQGEKASSLHNPEGYRKHRDHQEIRKASLQRFGNESLADLVAFVPPPLSSHPPGTPLRKEEQYFAAGGTFSWEQWLFPPELAAKEELEGGKAAACIPALPPWRMGHGKSRQIPTQTGTGVLMAKGPIVLYHFFALAVPVMCSPRALKAEIIPVYVPHQENVSKHSHMEPQGLSAPA